MLIDPLAANALSRIQSSGNLFVFRRKSAFLRRLPGDVTADCALGGIEETLIGGSAEETALEGIAGLYCLPVVGASGSNTKTARSSKQAEPVVELVVTKKKSWSVLAGTLSESCCITKPVTPLVCDSVACAEG